MRPINRGDSPRTTNYSNFATATNDLVARIGPYCSYCERRFPQGLEVEHIQPKDPNLGFAHLIGTWTNYLLACKNCNSTKWNKVVSLSDIYVPDRDNTFVPFEYTMDGIVAPSQGLSSPQVKIANDTLKLTGLDREYSQVKDENGAVVAVDRQSARYCLWRTAERSRNLLRANPTVEMRDLIAALAAAEGHFSIWMKVFEHDADMRQRFIERFPGTAKDCFDQNTHVITPRPNNGLDNAGKV